ncbi:MAG: CBS domain-containing protein [Rhodospirillaceae bacterium]
MQVADILKTKGAEVVTIQQTATIEAAAKVLRDRKFGALIVTGAGGTMVGIMSERDIIRVVGEMGANSLLLKVQDIMTRNVRTCRPEDSLDSLMQLMSKHRIRHIPILDGEKLVGLISQTDLIKTFIAEQTAQVQAMKNLNLAKK